MEMVGHGEYRRISCKNGEKKQHHIWIRSSTHICNWTPAKEAKIEWRMFNMLLMVWFIGFPCKLKSLLRGWISRQKFIKHVFWLQFSDFTPAQKWRNRQKKKKHTTRRDSSLYIFNSTPLFFMWTFLFTLSIVRDCVHTWHAATFEWKWMWAKRKVHTNAVRFIKMLKCAHRGWKTALRSGECLKNGKFMKFFADFPS